MARSSLTPRRVLGLTFVAAAVASLVLGARTVLPQLSRVEARYGGLTPAQSELNAESRHSLPDRVYAFYRAHVADRDRYFILEPADPTRVDPTGDIRAYVPYRLVPAVRVGDPSQATVVLAYGADPATLGVAYTSVVRLPGGPLVAVARIRG